MLSPILLSLIWQNPPFSAKFGAYNFSWGGGGWMERSNPESKFSVRSSNSGEKSWPDGELFYWRIKKMELISLPPLLQNVNTLMYFIYPEKLTLSSRNLNAGCIVLKYNQQLNYHEWTQNVTPLTHLHLKFQNHYKQACNISKMPWSNWLKYEGISMILTLGYKILLIYLVFTARKRSLG